MKVAWDDPRIAPEVSTATAIFIRERCEWTWWATFTFGREVTPQRASEVFRRFVRYLAQKVVRAHVHVAWVVDDNGGHVHLHTLLSLPPDALKVTVRGLENVWRVAARGLCGHTHIRKYDEEKGAAEYIAKKTPRRLWGLDIACSRRPRCRRGRGCIRSRSAW